MKNHRPTLLKFFSALFPITYDFHTHNSQLTTHNFAIILLALFIVIPSASLAQETSPTNLPTQSEILPPNNTDSQFENLYSDSDTTDYADLISKKLKNAKPRIVLPEGYPISDRRAKLVKLPDDHRWFLVFDEALQQLTPELAPKTNQKTEKSDLSLPKTVDKPPKTDQNSLKSDQNVASTANDKNLESENPFCRPIEVLPGKWLTAMTTAISRMDLSIDFRVWGEVTTYHDRNYIHPTRVLTLSLFGHDVAENVKNSKEINPLDAAFGPPKSVEPKISKQTQFLNKSILPNKLRDALLAIPRTRPLELPDVKQIPTLPKPNVEIPITSDGKKISKQNDWRDGYMIIDRMGRIHFDPEGMRWMLTLEADGASLAEPPLTLHPCRLLEVMEDTVGHSTESPRFRISGQINQYQGRNYLLLRKVLMVYDLGNLAK